MIEADFIQLRIYSHIHIFLIISIIMILMMRIIILWPRPRWRIYKVYWLQLNFPIWRQFFHRSLLKVVVMMNMTGQSILIVTKCGAVLSRVITDYIFTDLSISSIEPHGCLVMLKLLNHFIVGVIKSYKII